MAKNNNALMRDLAAKLISVSTNEFDEVFDFFEFTRGEHRALVVVATDGKYFDKLSALCDESMADHSYWQQIKSERVN